MITNTDITKLAQVLATKEDVKEIKEELRELKGVLNSHTTTIDGRVKSVSDLKDENKSINTI